MKNKEQQEKDWYETMLEMDLYHSKNSMPDLEETDEERLMNETVERIDDNSKDLPANEKRCFLCNTIAVGKPYNMGTCECPNSSDYTVKVLANSIRELITKNEPEKGLDRLHIFMVKYVRELCDKYQVSYQKETPLHSLFGGYIKEITKLGFIEIKFSIIMKVF